MGKQTRQTQTELDKLRRRLWSGNLDLEVIVIILAKIKALISCAVTAKMICTFVFAYSKCSFSHDAAQIYHHRWDTLENTKIGNLLVFIDSRLILNK